MSEPPDITLSPEAMRELGYRIVDMLVEHQATLAEGRAVTVGDAEALEAALAEPIPETGEEPGRLLEQLQREVFANMAHLDHPRFFGFVPSPGNFVGAMADALASGFNVFAGTWLGGSGPAEIERVTVDWLRQAVGFPEEAGGLFVSGGSVANITALAVARQRRLGGHDPSARIYYSDQTHSSIARGLKVLGFAEDQLVVLPTGGDCRLSLAALEVQIARDKAAGKRPFCVVANAGTTSTGAIDPLAALAALCRREQLWLHADGAYGAAAVLSGRGRTALAGLDQVDSLSFDPHKWLFQPFEAGCVLVREARWLRETFHTMPAYLADTETKHGEINFGEHGIQLSRSFRALKLWLSLKVFGRQAFARAIERGFALAELAERTLAQTSEWTIVTPAEMAVVSFCLALPGLAPETRDHIHQALIEALKQDGFALVTSTRLKGRVVLRMCTINPRTTDADIVATVERLTALAKAVVS